MDSLSVVILAAGKGSRMRSRKPKVVHRLAGKALIQHVVSAARSLDPEKVLVVTGHGAEEVEQIAAGDGIEFVRQAEQLGTGHATSQALTRIDSARTLILYGDVPLIGDATLNKWLEESRGTVLSVMTVMLDDPTGYGRILRDGHGKTVGIREQKDASEQELSIRECNTGMMICDTAALSEALSQTRNDNAQGEYYLTDIVEILAGKGEKVNTFCVADPIEVEGVNSRLQLEQLERAYQRKAATRLMEQGVTLRDSERIDIRGSLESGEDCEIDINCVFEGSVRLGDNVSIGPNCILSNCEIGSGSTILANSLIDSSTLGEHVTVGPFARIRPGTTMEDGSKLGNFVESKNSTIGKGSKVNHLSYVGDATIGEAVNIGAGTITCNYDGANKSRTIIGDNAFIGSNSALVAPVEIEQGATIGAGSVLTKNAPAEKLTLTRAKQITINNWTRPTKK